MVRTDNTDRVLTIMQLKCINLLIAYHKRLRVATIIGPIRSREVSLSVQGDTTTEGIPIYVFILLLTTVPLS